MSNVSIKGGWNTIDDAGETLPVTDVKQAALSAEKPAQAAPHSSTQPHRIGMHLSAFTGIAIVVVAVTMYIGVDSLRGSLTGTNSGTTTITMTADNHFSPSTISVAAGTTLVLENKNQNPQVLKAKAAPELFPTQVLFEKPYSFTIPSTVQGTFLYVSETMPKEELLTIIVTPAIETTGVSGADLPPLPFGGPLSEIVSSQASPVSGHDNAMTVIPASGESSGNQDTVTVISVGGTAQTSSASTNTKNTNDIPENPYTVANGKKNGSVGAQIAKNEKSLHSGAPLLDYPEYRPQRNTETGPVAWGIFVGALAMITIGYRRRITE